MRVVLIFTLCILFSLNAYFYFDNDPGFKLLTKCIPNSESIQVLISKTSGNISGKIYYEIFVNDRWIKIDSNDLMNVTLQTYTLNNQFNDPRLRIESKGNFSATLKIHSK